jgi:hypothetical protein
LEVDGLSSNITGNEDNVNNLVTIHVGNNPIITVISIKPNIPNQGVIRLIKYPNSSLNDMANSILFNIVINLFQISLGSKKGRIDLNVESFNTFAQLYLFLY